MNANYIELPENVMNEIKSCWYSRERRIADNTQEAKAMFEEFTGYGLKLYWLKSGMKLNPANTAVFQWITDNFVPKNIQEKYPSTSFDEPMFKNEDYTKLRKVTLDSLWASYLQNPNNDIIAEPVKKSTLKSLFKK